MSDNGLDPQQVGLGIASSIAGATGIKFIERFLNRKKVKDDAATAFRAEVSADNKTLREENRSLRAELKQAKDDYWDEVEKSATEMMNARLTSRKATVLVDVALEHHPEDERLEELKDLPE